MRRRTKTARNGNSLIEFTLLGIPLLFMTLSIVEISIDMWEFHNLAFVTEATCRYTTMHGATCSQNGNSCTITVGSVATFFQNEAMALSPSAVVVNLTDGSGTTTCNPVNSCTSSATQFPNSSYNSVGSNVTISATYVLKNPVAIFWPPYADPPHDFNVGATSTQRIVF
jgi:Flp pilus assembly protein TadG